MWMVFEPPPPTNNVPRNTHWLRWPLFKLEACPLFFLDKYVVIQVSLMADYVVVLTEKYDLLHLQVKNVHIGWWYMSYLRYVVYLQSKICARESYQFSAKEYQNIRIFFINDKYCSPCSCLTLDSWSTRTILWSRETRWTRWQTSILTSLSQTFHIQRGEGGTFPWIMQLFLTQPAW